MGKSGGHETLEEFDMFFQVSWYKQQNLKEEMFIRMFPILILRVLPKTLKLSTWPFISLLLAYELACVLDL